eukprot:CAMPEP_0180425712 /NCGR_PEP_ID=MMETSP1036_2-20121128/5414_1 /TAXON_ID=632150 /ORGANISM="Azadinium spinosum, Strain 3D9" /LENGTH=68 /DNA_ID=CAMNT_0022431229 /DNA_START=393 /DNA_END=599 /DNA_ORIENTATION=-
MRSVARQAIGIVDEVLEEMRGKLHEVHSAARSGKVLKLGLREKGMHRMAYLVHESDRKRQGQAYRPDR